MSSDLPETVAWFVRQLQNSGFAEIGRESGPMDSAVIVFRRDPVELRLSRTARSGRSI
jgi:hypothetical protein